MARWAAALVAAMNGLAIASAAWAGPALAGGKAAGQGVQSAGKVWVYFRDKGIKGDSERDRALADLQAGYDARAIQRRRLRRSAPGLFDERDLPVAEQYVAAVGATGVRIHVQSRWLNAVSVYATPAQREELGRLACVRAVEPVRAGRQIEAPVDEGTPYVPSGPVHRGPPPLEGAAFNQQVLMDIVALHDHGSTGAGIVIGILDTGFRRTHTAFNTPGHVLQVVAEHDFVFGDDNTTNEPDDDPGQDHHGTYVLGLLGAYAPGSYCGAAFDASFVLCKTEDIRSETPVEEDNYVAGLEFIEMHGADMATSSLAYFDWYTPSDFDGRTAVTTIAVNTATENGLICLTAQGNGGHDSDPTTLTLGAPADALRVLSIGAVDINGGTAGFTSDGPSFDGRVKPEVLGMGVSNPIVSISDDAGYVSGSGTSFATPLAAGAVACILQAHPTWSVDQMRAYLMLSATDYRANGTFDALFVRGFGIIDAALASTEDCDGDGVSDSAAIAAGTVPDCNANGIPDSCDIALGILAGGSADADADGRPDECPACPGDWNRSGAVNSQDLFDFLAAFFSSNADFNHDGGTNSQDLFDFLASFFAGCP